MREREREKREKKYGACTNALRMINERVVQTPITLFRRSIIVQSTPENLLLLHRHGKNRV